jgi:hypothetical protein
MELKTLSLLDESVTSDCTNYFCSNKMEEKLSNSFLFLLQNFLSSSFIILIRATFGI